MATTPLEAPPKLKKPAPPSTDPGLPASVPTPPRAMPKVPVRRRPYGRWAVTGAVIVAFRWVTEHGPVLFGLLPAPEAFELLDPIHRLLLPLGGALAVGVLLTVTRLESRELGVVHVMERLARHAGRLPLRNALVQFAGAAVAVVGGLSVGREGPIG